MGVKVRSLSPFTTSRWAKRWPRRLRWLRGLLRLQRFAAQRGHEHHHQRHERQAGYRVQPYGHGRRQPVRDRASHQQTQRPRSDGR